MNNIYLVGMMGSGKSVTGEILAEHLKRSFVECDQLIVKKSGQTVAEIFETKGEESFRDLESEILKDLIRLDNHIISTGGGVVVRSQNIKRMKDTGKIVYLRSKAETLCQRTKGDSSRPLLNTDDPLKRIRQMLEERSKFYSQADIIVDTDGKQAKTVAEEISRALESHAGKS